MSPSRRILRRPAPDAIGSDWPAEVPEVLRRLYAARGARAWSEAQPKLAGLLPPDGMRGLDAAVALLADAIARDAHIVVVGDFDCDGATACAVGVRGLRMLGATRVSHAVPNRIVHGYGLSPGLVEDLARMQPDLLVTVDHGIACHAGVAEAKARGWRVLVTDHHLPGEALPPADAIVDPNVPGDAFPSKALAGVGVMFYVLLALRRHLRDAGAFPGAPPDLTVLLDLVAVGTVADLVPLDANNRALVAAGLRRLRAGQGCAGLKALIEVAKRRVETLTATDIGFAIGPRINAAGRLEDMGVGIACLLTDDLAHARALAGTLDAINAERKGVQQQMVQGAEAALASLHPDEGASMLAPCLFNAEWHPGVVGLVASKLKERLHRPTLAFAPSEPGSDVLRGSARSIPGFHMRDALAAVDAQHPGMIERFGGHAMAAGLTLHHDRLPAFIDAFTTVARTWLTPELLQEDILSDGELAPTECGDALARALRDGGPWGQAFPEPLFDGAFDVVDWRIVGETHLKLELAWPGTRQRVNAIHFGGWSGTPPAAREHLAYRLQPDDWRGGGAVQLVVVHRTPVA